MSIASLASATIRRLEGKVALITGAARGIGECTARTFVKHGAKVLIADVKDELGKFVSKDIGPGFASFVHCDVTRETDVENAVNQVISHYGKLDIMFNNAGTIELPKTDILENEVSDFEQVLKVNLTGAFLGIKHAARVMKPARRGSIITTASVCSTVGGAATHAYTSSKHGVVGLMRNTAVELGQYGIRVNCVSPYSVATPLTKEILNLDEEGIRGLYANLKGTVLEPEDIARAALYLASDESKYVSGHNLIVDGGYTITNAGFSMVENLNDLTLGSKRKRG
ncbi:hypothetical protein DITRI_Ditri18aG0011900 [Diplodiscus trichospermus]